MLIPLKQFYCDVCGAVIKSPDDGCIEWASDYDGETKHTIIHDLAIVHTKNRENLGQPCTWLDGNRKTMALSSFIEDESKMINLLSLFTLSENYKYIDIHDLVDTPLAEFLFLIRRLTIPYFEEAYTYWSEANRHGFFEDKNELEIYSKNNLIKLIEKYGDSEG